MNPVSTASAALDTRVLAMALSDVRATITSTQAASAHAGESPSQPADVILELSTAAQQLLGR